MNIHRINLNTVLNLAGPILYRHTHTSKFYCTLLNILLRSQG